jgi:hypothetical protein
MRRRARDLRKGLFGPKRLSDVPKGEGLTYDAPPDDRNTPGNVAAEFIPPPMRRRGAVSTLRAEGSAREAVGVVAQ